eukprot:TRINITY_DN1602_c0_g1_i1.p1 TRINITY_DN1602_c0_g1~~TRINITY_DN1602_c0_g1_i1.p1  ORF type:complete len:153 (+),score=26.90 TRINITY_DN1602_c0_g1_i1:62-520(+)
MMNMDEDRMDRRYLIALFAGVMFAGGWIMFADGFVIARQNTGTHQHSKDWAPGLVATVAFFFMNLITPQHLSEESGMYDEREVGMNKAWFFFSVLVMFAAITMAVVFLITDYSKESGDLEYPGIANLMQTLLISVSSFAFFMSRGRKNDETW